ncbi:hypothetical protein [Streptomyces yaizuensis]|uniref:GerMN domain-containing protein n=1 Tax=Streptomyces yaizuensis TaxID=2989713 RepID=A0ABQ5PAC1_9ACTN|nr:hypothetical protein [Streptomyces sp. YSPA8]GLF99440.1 GerMN domain-containing protein [Streptomyces sp. YSPA8]
MSTLRTPRRPTPEGGRAVMITLAALLLATGCGVRPTGVLDGGDPAGGLTKGMRLYFVSPTGRLEAVPRPDIEPSKAGDPAGVIKLLGGGMSDAERAAGLTSEVPGRTYAETDKEGRVSVIIPYEALDPSSVDDRNLMGQLVCSIARGQAVAEEDGTRRTDDIPVRVAALDREFTSYVCSDFLK